MSERRLPVLDIPDSKAAGYCYRLEAFIEIQELLDDANQGNAVSGMKAMLRISDFLLDYVVEPNDPDEARELFRGKNGLSQNDLLTLFNSLKNGDSEAEENGPLATNETLELEAA